MHYYPHHIGDFRKDTPHLSPSQKGIYRDLLDFAYATEKPLPNDLDMLCRVCGAVRPAERLIVPALLNEFFTETEQGWEHKRVIHEIKKYYSKARAGTAGADAKHYGKSSGKPAGKPTGTEAGTTLGEPESNHNARNKPRTNNQEPATTSPPGGGPAATTTDPPASSHQPPAEPPPPSETPESEKKEGAAPDPSLWLDLDTPECRRAINRALLRDERHHFSSAELHELGNFAAHSHGQFQLLALHQLHRYLSAAPAYNNRDTAAHDALPEGSLLRKRKRWPGNVISDLANHLTLAQQWAAQREKKNGGPEDGEVIGRAAPPGWQAACAELFPHLPAPADFFALPVTSQRDIRVWLNQPAAPAP